MNLGITGLGEATEIGRGGSATVFRARRDIDGVAVAVKVLDVTDERFVERFEREARALTTLSRSPRIVTVHEAGTTAAGRPYLVLDLCESTLLDRLGRVGSIEALEACDILADVAEAVADAHLIGVVHRDLKPANILLSADGEHLVADFGLSSVLGSTTTESLSLAFTAGYVAPETLAGISPGPPADVYALGATLYHLVAGEPPFNVDDGDTNIFAVANRVANEALPDLRADGVPGAVCALIESAMAKDPLARPTAAEFQRQAVRVASGVVVEADPPVVDVGSSRRVVPPSTPSPSDLAAPPDLPRYGDLELVGRVERGSLFVGVDPDDGDGGSRTVLIRVLDSREFDPANRKSFRASRAALRAATYHPRLVALLDYGYTTDGRPFDVSLYLGDETLADQVKAEGPLPWPRLVEVGIMAAEGLESLHRQGVGHGALVPSSLFQLDDGEVAVGNYGLAATSADDEARRRADDLRGLGTMLASLAGVDVDPSAARPEVERAVAGAENLGTGPITLLKLLADLADPDASRRPPTAHEVASLLQQVQADLAIAVTPIDLDPSSAPVDDQDEKEAAAFVPDQRWAPPASQAPALEPPAYEPPASDGPSSIPEHGRPEPVAAIEGGLFDHATETTELGEALAAYAANQAVVEVSSKSASILDDGAAANRSADVDRVGVTRFEPTSGGAPWADVLDSAGARARSVIGGLMGVAAALALLGVGYLVLQRVTASQTEAGAGPSTSTASVVAAVVPIVVGLDEDAATARIENAGFRPIVSYEFDPETARGQVSSSVPASGVSAEIGATVALVISRGSEPNCIGSTEQGVRRQLDARDLAVAGITRSHSDSVEADLVIRCVIYDDTETAIIVVSDGPRPTAEDE